LLISNSKSTLDQACVEVREKKFIIEIEENYRDKVDFTTCNILKDINIILLYNFKISYKNVHRISISSGL